MKLIRMTNGLNRKRWFIIEDKDDNSAGFLTFDSIFLCFLIVSDPNKALSFRFAWMAKITMTDYLISVMIKKHDREYRSKAREWRIED